MKKSMIIGVFLTLLLTLSACAPQEDNQKTSSNHHHKNGVNAPEYAKNLTESDIFSSDKKGQKLSEDEMNKAIKKYLDVNSDILDNKYVMQSEIDRQSTGQTRVTDEQAKKLSNLSNLAVKNDLHFKKFVKNNTLPSGYKENVDRIINYFHALNSTISDVDKSIEELNYEPQNTINVVDVPTHYAGDVNGKQQDKIQKFLDDKNIKTDVLDK
ncbi:NDxxF motif lipoprotein [Staphylococcus devriesei]|uniref:NDxxF motif lipoprotein n=1 Tax=Staphylococcus devriesei TaxID=586733 RepID=A0A2T4KFE6_9STAP|nr:NDxxF motif lipoprotein [Staphylococcus devriesei]PTE71044.1 NDxxF motif lipoprotein [Staphylococcus devriesei]RIL75369.1 NDxxF motif lipoprotein [Staphylococcus devriesei]WKU12583.1 NDxxF motif lipoprotein [Staphylococcus devriesei]